MKETPTERRVAESRPPVPLAVIGRAAGRATGAWWAHVLLGLVVIALGLFALASQVNALSTIVALVGALLLCGGAAEIVVGSISRPASWLAIAAGTGSITLGTFALAWPAATLYVVAVFAGIGLLVWGVYDAYRALTDPFVRPRFAALILGLALATLGVTVLVHPGFSALVLGTLVGICLVVQGVFSFVVGLRMLDAHRALGRLERDLGHAAQSDETWPGKAA